MKIIIGNNYKLIAFPRSDVFYSIDKIIKMLYVIDLTYDNTKNENNGILEG